MNSAERATISDTEPVVDLVVAVHTESRPVERAVSSALANPSTPVRVTVVCHGVEPDLIAQRLGDLSLDSRVRLLHFTDGIPSPSGPFNHGLDAATGHFTAVLGSDDELEPGAIDSWIALQRRSGADIIIPRLRTASGTSLRTPPTRPGRMHRLDGARDRLAYRTAQLGLVSRERFGHLRFTTGLRSGEDIAYGLRLWFSRSRIALDRHGPAYLIHEDVNDRTTVSLKSVDDDFAFLGGALDPGWIETLTPEQREAIAVKLARTHLIDALRSRFLGADPPSVDERESLTRVTRRILDVAPDTDRILSRLDARLLTAVLDADSDASMIAGLLHRRSILLHPTNLVSASLGKLLHREAPLRFYASVTLTR